MKNILITLLFATFLMAEDNNTTVEIVTAPNPKVYAALGDVVYDDAQNVNKLQYISKYSNKTQKIQDYIADVNKTKKMGYAIENGDKSLDKANYLKNMRVLLKRNDEFKKDVAKSYKSSMAYKDNSFFSEIINSGLLDTRKYKSEIMDYYLKNSADIDKTGVIQAYLDEDTLSRNKAKQAKKPVVTRKQIQDAKIKRIKKNDKNKEAKIEQELENEFRQKKSDILAEQLESLSK